MNDKEQAELGWEFLYQALRDAVHAFADAERIVRDLNRLGEDVGELTKSVSDYRRGSQWLVSIYFNRHPLGGLDFQTPTRED